MFLQFLKELEDLLKLVQDCGALSTRLLYTILPRPCNSGANKASVCKLLESVRDRKLRLFRRANRFLKPRQRQLLEVPIYATVYNLKRPKTLHPAIHKFECVVLYQLTLLCFYNTCSIIKAFYKAGLYKDTKQSLFIS
jgi:hypothetical protein